MVDAGGFFSTLSSIPLTSFSFFFLSFFPPFCSVSVEICKSVVHVFGSV